VLNVLLNKYTDQDDVIVGCSTAGRPHSDLHRMVGMFANMLAIRNNPDEQSTYLEFLEKVKLNALDAFANQEVQFDTLIEKLDLEWESCRNPLFDVALTLENYEQPEFELESLTFTPYHFYNRSSKFDMTLWANEIGKEIIFNLEYSTELFKRTTMEKFAHRFVEIIKQVIENRNIKLKDINISHDLARSKSDVPQMEFQF
jgi:tyrocidine synthetase-3